MSATMVAAALDWSQDVNPVVYTIGLVWFLVALMGLGYGLVDKAPVWLRAVVSVATPLLGYGVWFTISDAFASNYLPVDAGTYDLDVRPTGTETVAIDINGFMAEAGTIYTVFATGLAGDGSLGVLPLVDATRWTSGAPAMVSGAVSGSET